MFLRGAIAIATVFGLSTAGLGAVLETKPFARPERGGLVCRAVNRSAREHRMRIEALDATGDTTFDTGRFVLAPGAVFLSGVGVRARRCRFRIAGDGEGIRASALLVAGEGERSQAAEAMPPADAGSQEAER